MQENTAPQPLGDDMNDLKDAFDSLSMAAFTLSAAVDEVVSAIEERRVAAINPDPRFRPNRRKAVPGGQQDTAVKQG